MLTRTAIYEGTIHKGKEDEFFRRVRDELEPMRQRFPNVTLVRVQRTVKNDGDDRPIAMILEMDFPDMKAIDECLASSIWPQVARGYQKGDDAVRRALLPLRHGGDGAGAGDVKTRPVLAAADARILLEAARGEAERLVGAAAP